jgi:hypothetical protein
MICYIAVLLLHFAVSVSVLPKMAVAPVVSLPEAPIPHPEARFSIQVVSSDSEEVTQSGASDSGAQIPQAFAANDTPAPPPAKPIQLIPVENVHPRPPWLILSAVQHGAAGFDAYSTRRAVRNGGVEMGPLMRPFAHSPAIYAAIQLGPAMLDVLARHMQRSQNSLLRRTWWVSQSASTGVFLFSGLHNLQVANKP